MSNIIKTKRMPANYEFYKNPRNKFSEGEETYHARIVPSGTVDIKRLAEEIQQYSSLSTADVKAVLEMLVIVASHNLSYGSTVKLDGLGTLQMTLNCPKVTDTKEIHAQSVKFKSVTFRPAKDLKNKLKTTKFYHVQENVKSYSHTDEEIEARLIHYYNRKPTMTRYDFQRLCGFTRTTAIRYIRELTKAGKIINVASKNNPVYVKGNIGTEKP